MAARRITPPLLPIGVFSNRRDTPFKDVFRVTDSRLSRPSGSAYLLYVSAPSGLIELLLDEAWRAGWGCSGEAYELPPEARLLSRIAPDLGFGAESAVRYSGSLTSPSANSSTSSELAASKPANRLLIR